ncbi:MAG: hypothetical protein ACI86H_001756 [bacterium]|jgi:hypothetical protein
MGGFRIYKLSANLVAKISSEICLAFIKIANFLFGFIPAIGTFGLFG